MDLLLPLTALAHSLPLCPGIGGLLLTYCEGCWCTLAALLALETSSYLALKLRNILLLSQSVIGPRLLSTGGIIWRLISCSIDVVHEPNIMSLHKSASQRAMCSSLEAYSPHKCCQQCVRIADVIRHRKLWWLGHLARMSDDRLPKHVLFGVMEGPGIRGTTIKSWSEHVKEDLHCLGLQCSWYRKAQDRAGWRAAIECLLQRT